MSLPSYATPPAHRVSLEKRLRNICDALDLNELRTRTSLAHTVIAQLLPVGVVKGGAAIKFRAGLPATSMPPEGLNTPLKPMRQSCPFGWPTGGKASQAGLLIVFPLTRPTCPAST